jgi:hypothetical protein
LSIFPEDILPGAHPKTGKVSALMPIEIFGTLWINVLPDVSTLHTCRTQPTINIKDKNINNTNYLLSQFGATHLLWGIPIQE